MLEKLNKLGNYEIGKDFGLVSINPKIYPLENIKKACKKFSTKATIIMDGDPENEIIIEFITKKPKEVLLSFANELCKGL